MHRAKEGIAIPVIAGLTTGILFIFLLALASNPTMLALDDYLEADQRTIDKMSQHKTVQLFLDKYPYSQRSLTYSFDTGFPYWLSYHANARIVLDYNSPTLMTERGIHLLVFADTDANVKKVMLFCGDAKNIPIADANVTSEAEVMRWLKEDRC